MRQRVGAHRRNACVLTVLAAVLNGCGVAGDASDDGPVQLIDGGVLARSGVLARAADWRRVESPAEGMRAGVDRVLAYPDLPDVPAGYRASAALAESGWLVAELYSQRPDADVADFLSLVVDPDRPSHRVIELRTREHTDGAILRSREALPREYRISFRIGHIRYGGVDALNGYDSGDESAGPWMTIPATGHNGIYWGAVVDTLPQPRENIWSHHHRKFFIDTWNYRRRMLGVTVAAVDGRGAVSARTGKPFIAHDGQQWKLHSTEPAFFYRPDRWYRVVIERRRGRFGFSVEGDFHGVGPYRFADSIDVEEACVYHYNRDAGELAPACLVGDFLETGSGLAEVWPAASGFPDFFMLGDPHVNFYEGAALFDSLRLEAL